MSDEIKADFSTELSRRYLAYALSTITSRSLPDVRDGLKPVHRRLLYAMRQLRLDPEQGFKKSARVVGDVMGKFHPHGDSAIYDAMVRLAQEFAMRYPLVDGQGNFGNIDGDNAAAMRYTEARMTMVARLLLDGIDENAVDFRPTYDGEDEEPIVLPAAFPNLLANGAQGIAVGMATSIPPHNVTELTGAALHLLKHPTATDARIATIVQGPDFPTGGVLVESPEMIAEAYATGRGSFRVRADWMTEKESGGNWKIVITAIPYQVQKSRLVEKIAELVMAKKLPFLADVQDESTDELRLVLLPKSRRFEADMIMENLFRMTDLESRISLNLNVLDASGSPGVMSIKDALLAWIDHLLVVLRRRKKYRLEKIAARLEALEGYLVVYLNLDEVIAIIREEDNPASVLMARWTLNQNQVDAILNMRLRSLRKLEEIEIKRESEALKNEQRDIELILASEDAQRAMVAENIKAVKALFQRDDHRRTRLAALPVLDSEPGALLLEKEPITVVCSQQGWVRGMKGRIENSDDIRFKEGDAAAFHFYAESTDKIIVALDNGRFFTINANKLPGGRGFGEPVSLMISMAREYRITAMFVAGAQHVLVVSGEGRGFITEGEGLVTRTRNGRQVINLAKGHKMVVAKPVEGDMAAFVGDNRQMLAVPIKDIPVMTRGRGLIMQRYKTGGLADATTYSMDEGLSWQQPGGRTRSEKDTSKWQGRRGGAGTLLPSGFPKPPRFT